ncbi:hypothetical protein ACOCEA_01355 [Maribacter sp. CXY002]|uniref:hypothetical protein n=1 Tax=Maribacter luteocoastalis TaxID=3407671 RepID=UPI003B679A3A
MKKITLFLLNCIALLSSIAVCAKGNIKMANTGGCLIVNANTITNDLYIRI